MSATVTNCLDDTSAANHLVPASDTQLAISCDDAGTCVNTVDATLDTPDGVRACIVVSGQGHTVKADSAVAAALISTPANRCSPIRNDPDMDINTAVAVFSNDFAKAEWLNGKGSYFAFSFCQDRGSSKVICEGASGITGAVGEVQFCGGECVMVYLGSQDDDSCGTGEERRFYESVCRVISDVYSIYELAFTDFEVRYVAVVNGTAWNLWEEQPADMTLSVESLELANPFEGYEMALQGSDYSTAYASQSAMNVTNCNGYCGLARVRLGSTDMTMYGNCVTPNSGCTSGSSSCTATVQSFDQSRAGEKLPVTDSGATLEYNGTNVIVQYSASAIPLKGRVEFSVPNAERVLPSEAATNVNGIVTTLLPQDANHEDVVVVYTDGAVATASRDCAFTLLETRDKNRMYSMRNVRNVTECDLLVSNGASERSLSVAAQTTKNSGAVPVANATALWPAHPPGSESRSSGLSKGAKIGIGVGVPVGVIVIACAIVLFVYRCRRKKEVSPLSSEEVVEPEVAEPPKEGNPLVAAGASGGTAAESGDGKPAQAAEAVPATTSENREDGEASTENAVAEQPTTQGEADVLRISSDYSFDSSQFPGFGEDSVIDMHTSEHPARENPPGSAAEVAPLANQRQMSEEVVVVRNPSLRFFFVNGKFDLELFNEYTVDRTHTKEMQEAYVVPPEFPEKYDDSRIPPKRDSMGEIIRGPRKMEPEDWLHVNIRNYYNYDMVYKNIKVPVDAPIGSLRGFLYGNCERMAADGALKAGVTMAQATRAGLEASARDDNFNDINRYGIYCQGKLQLNESRTFSAVAAGITNPEFFIAPYEP